jgi:hypothetical protein
MQISIKICPFIFSNADIQKQQKRGPTLRVAAGRPGIGRAIDPLKIKSILEVQKTQPSKMVSTKCASNEFLIRGRGSEGSSVSKICNALFSSVLYGFPAATPRGAVGRLLVPPPSGRDKALSSNRHKPSAEAKRPPPPP